MYRDTTLTDYTSNGGEVRPVTASSRSNSIVNMLVKHKRTAAAASHLVENHSAPNPRASSVLTNTVRQAVKNLIVRNPKLPETLVEKHAIAEFSKAQQAGKMFTAKEIADVEDHIYAKVNFKQNYGV